VNVVEVKYSKYGLIQEEMLTLEETGIVDRLLSFFRERKLKFNIMVPNEFYARAEALCDDIVQMRTEDKDYSQSELAEHIFLDFLDVVRKNDSNVGAIHNKLHVRKQELPLINENPLTPKKSSTSLIVKLNREDALRAEWLLKDLSYFVPNHKMEVDTLIEIVYLDFLLEYTKGRRKNVIKEILEYID
jgi:hypothetical protein